MLEKELQTLSENLTNVRLDIRELMTEVRNLKDLSKEVNSQEIRLAKAEESIISNVKRLDKIDKYSFWLVTTVIGSMVVAVASLVIK